MDQSPRFCAWEHLGSTRGRNKDRVKEKEEKKQEKHKNIENQVIHQGTCTIPGFRPKLHFQLLSCEWHDTCTTPGLRPRLQFWAVLCALKGTCTIPGSRPKVRFRQLCVSSAVHVPLQVGSPDCILYDSCLHQGPCSTGGLRPKLILVLAARCMYISRFEV